MASRLAEFKLKIENINFIQPELLSYNNDNGFASATLNWKDGKLVIAVQSKMHPQLSDEINNILYHSDTIFGTRLSFKEAKNSNSQDVDIDFQKSELIDFEFKNYQDHKIFLFYIDTVTIIRTSVSNKDYARFVLNDSGYNMIKDFFGVALLMDNEFTAPKPDEEYCFEINKVKFYPKLELKLIQNSTNLKDIIINKTPVIEAHEINSPEKTLNYFEYLICLMKLFYRTEIDFIIGSICSSDKTVSIYKIPNDNTNLKKQPLSFILNGIKDFNSFFLHINQVKSLNKFYELKVIVDLYLSSSYVRDKTQYLILHNILENCESTEQTEKGFKFTSEKLIHTRYIDLLKEIIDLVKDEEKEDFKKKWESGWGNLVYIPDLPRTLKYWKQCGINGELMNERVQKYTSNKCKHLGKLRNDVIHGKVNLEQINFQQINRYLTLIAIILILRIAGFEKMELEKFGQDDLFDIFE